MIKKTFLAFMTALLLVVPFAGIASADEGGQTEDRPGHPNHSAIGKIIDIGRDDFTVITRKGEFTIIVTDDTIFKNREGETISFSDLEVDRYVAGRTVKDDEGNLIARLVILLPEDFDPQEVEILRLMGEVDKINNGQSTFDLITREGDVLTLHVTDRTRFLGNLSELKDLEKGMLVGVGAIRGEEGNILALAVTDKRPGGERPQKTRSLGEVTSVGADAISIVKKNGDTFTFTINENTQFVSRDQPVDLSDIEPGQKVVISFTETDEGSLIAKFIGVGQK